MTITKYEHACFTVEKDNKLIVVDPGERVNLPDLSNVVAVVITHKHGDHLGLENIRKITEVNPAVILVGIDEVLDELTALPAERRAVKAGDVLEVSDFKVEFFGGEHAIIYETVPCKNLGIMIDDELYYPGDSFTNPEKSVKVLGVPAAAPWMKVGEAMDFIKLIQPEIVFPNHIGTLSEIGKTFNYNWLNQACDAVDADFRPLELGQQL